MYFAVHQQRCGAELGQVGRSQGATQTRTQRGVPARVELCSLTTFVLFWYLEGVSTTEESSAGGVVVVDHPCFEWLADMLNTLG